MIMTIPPKFVVIDDKEEHLGPIIEAFKEMGTSCNGIKYDIENETHLNPKYYRGVRFLFSDLHLNTASSDGKSHYATIIHILEKIINKENGPYILILWTSYPNQCEEFINYLDECTGDKNKYYWKPMHVASLSKSNYAIEGNQEIIKENINKLHDDIVQIINSVPSINLLFKWESEITNSASQTINEIISLDLKEKEKEKEKEKDNNKITEQNNTSNPLDKLSIIFRHIAENTVGSSHVDTNPKKAFNLPVLIDKILNNKDEDSCWKISIEKLKDGEGKNIRLTNEDTGKFNRILHLSTSEHEELSSLDWGVVIEFKNNNDECNEYTKNTFKNLLDYDNNDIFNNEFNISDIFEIEKKEQNNSFLIEKEPILVRIGAACDYAQNKEVIIPYVIGYKISSSNENKLAKKINRLSKDYPSFWVSPLFLGYEKDEENKTYKKSFYIVLKLSLQVMLKKCFFADSNDKIIIRYRIREQLLTNLIQKIANYSSRVGFNQLR